jgi:N-acetylglucosaminyl-diphospho-decaprenol L-rhamnosyltransferase
MPGCITVSIVSHGHGAMLPALLADLSVCPEVACVHLTLNVPESLPESSLVGALYVTRNRLPKGFAANHNAAIAKADTPYVLVLNPDVRLVGNPFPALLDCLRDGAVLCAPAVINPAGGAEDSVRRFPTVLGLLRKALGRDDGRLTLGTGCAVAPWVAGMFMLVDRRAFGVVDGFDAGFFLYYEDVDLCVRLWRAGYAVRWCGKTSVIHDARRASRRDLRHLLWHLSSMLRYFIKHAGRLPPVST